tara:strand:- start:7 stop:402 length:396 start_codon:yes stop_codon:yes gene_type:complete
MYKVLDKNNNLLAIVNKKIDDTKSKNFLTSDEMSMQFATFNLKKGEEIKRHIHNKQERMIETTAEAITILEGSMKVNLYDYEHKLLEQVTLNKHESIILFEGGHGLIMEEDCRFLEVKQGPYDQENDKYHF